MPYYSIGDADEYRYADQYETRYLARLYAHPDCRDPEHPGCERCEYDFNEYICEDN